MHEKPYFVHIKLFINAYSDFFNARDGEQLKHFLI